MLFKIKAINQEGNVKTFSYDNENNQITTPDGTFIEKSLDREYSTAVVFSKDIPLKKSNLVKTLKIQLGLSCNYSCNYCSQRFVERPPEKSAKHINNFLSKLDNLQYDKKLNIQLWGGEPLVYWKTLVPLTERLREYFLEKDVELNITMITNGSLLDIEKATWIIHNIDGMSISHDGPGQVVRGDDPFSNPRVLEAVLHLYNNFPKGRMGFGSMLNNQNKSRKEILDYFVNLTGDKDVHINEGGFADTYDDDTFSSTKMSLQNSFDFRKLSYSEIIENNLTKNYSQVNSKIHSVLDSLKSNRPSTTIPQKCGADNPSTLSIDLEGNVITCQNTSSLEVSKNGQPHLSGKVEDVSNVKITSSTHWSLREHCRSCPVVVSCKGSCMFLEGEYWNQSCMSSYDENIVYFAIAFSIITGYTPVFIDNENLPKERRDIWGEYLLHEKKPGVIPRNANKT